MGEPQRSEAIVGQEASVLRSIYRESVASPPETQEHLHDLVGEYATEVTDQAWPAMAQAEPGHPRVGDVLDEMAIAISSVPVTTPAQQESVGAEAERLSRLAGFRSKRIDYVDRDIPASCGSP